MRIYILSCLLVLSSAGSALAATPNPQAPALDANAHAERIKDAKQYLADIDQAFAMAASGDYGRLQRGWQERALAARDRIAGLLEGHTSALELSPSERSELHAAQYEINSLLNHEDKGRLVCKKVFQTGSRLNKSTECLTVAEREMRAQAVRQNVDKIQQENCIQGEGQACGG